MHVILSAHLDTVYRDPYCHLGNGTMTGACDNIAGVFAVAQLIQETDLDAYLTEDEEMHMDGARYVARSYSADDTFVIVVEVTERGRKWAKLHFTVENWRGIKPRLIKSCLREFSGQYKMVEHGSESEAWLYRELGFSCLEICVPVAGGLHSLDGRARLEDIAVAARAIKTVADFIKTKSREEISDNYRVGDSA